jgi:cytoskeletal protein CcmA (bactofilin family)
MFGSSKEKTPASTAMSLPGANDKEGNMTTVIAKGTTIEGKFSCGENVRLDGAIHGEVKVDKRFVMGDTSYVQGNINARDAAVKGRVKGDIVVKEALHLMDTAIVEGNISAKSLIVDEGARHNGTSRIGESSNNTVAAPLAKAN